MKNILAYLEQHSDVILSDILALVEAESPSMNKAAVDRCGEVLQRLFAERLGVEAETDVQEEYGNHLKFVLGSGNEKTVVLGHFDTVWDEGELPVRREDGRLYGPACWT